jgi:hypothetical protein
MPVFLLKTAYLVNFLHQMNPSGLSVRVTGCHMMFLLQAVNKVQTVVHEFYPGRIVFCFFSQNICFFKDVLHFKQGSFEAAFLPFPVHRQHNS